MPLPAAGGPLAPIYERDTLGCSLTSGPSSNELEKKGKTAVGVRAHYSRGDRWNASLPPSGG